MRTRFTVHPNAKVVFLGGEGVGKTSIVARATGGGFRPDQQSTVGSQYSTLDITHENQTLTLRIWDTAGQERYRSLGPMYYQNSDVAIIVFALTDEKSFICAGGWIAELNEYFEDPPKLFIVGNKSDLQDRVISNENGNSFAAAVSAEYFETSAKTGDAIEDLFDAVGTYLLQKPAQIPDIAPIPVPQEAEKRCSC
jgi:small GTP-binding protein